MLIKNFQGETTHEAMKKIKEEFGNNAVILNTQVIDEKTGLRGKPVKRVEITAGRDVPVNQRTPIKKESTVDRGISGLDSKQALDISLLLRRFEKEIKYLVNSQKEIRRLLSTPENMLPLSRHLENQDLEKDLIIKLFEKATTESTPDLELLRARLISLCEQPQPVKLFASGVNKVVFVGPPGVGKSSLLAKIASNLVIKKQVQTSLVNLDDYKPTAKEELETYANLLKVTCQDEEEWVEPVETEEMKVVLADTRGVPVGAVDDLAELKEKLENFAPDEIHLVIPAYTRWLEVQHWLNFYEALHPTQTAVTFMDQTEAFGLPFNLAGYRKSKLSYASWGRNKASHLQEIDLHKLSWKLIETMEDANV